MVRQQIELTIFFADIADSTKLYETFGDVNAHDWIVEALDQISDFVKENDGVVVEIIGDEIMAYFYKAEKAFSCACDIQQHFHSSTKSYNHRISVRIGFHRGIVNIDDGNPFGDNVNIASRVASLALGGQIVTTRETVEDLSPMHLSCCRTLSCIRVKGKSQALNTIQVVWNPNEATVASEPVEKMGKSPPASGIEINYQGHKFMIRESDTPFFIGRGERCHLVVSSETASRAHARIVTRFGEFVVIDTSTNGTYIITDPGKRAHDGLDMHLHYREWTMAGHGKISLGRPVSVCDELVIEFATIASR